MVSRRDVLKGAAGLTAAVGLSGLPSRIPRLLHADGAPSVPSAGKRGGVLTIGLSDTETSETLNPATASVGSQYVLFELLFNTLTVVHYLDNWSITPGLAESWESNSALTKWQFKLRPGVTFHDGSPLTAEDVVWTVQQVLNPKVGSSAYARAAQTMTPKSVRAINSHTVAFDLIRSDSLLPALLARCQLSIIKKGTTNFRASNTVGTGPFKLKSWQPATSWEVERNPHYWESGLPYLDSVREVINTDTAALADGVLSGEFGLAGEIDFSAARDLATNPKVHVLKFTRGISRLIVMDCSHKPFSDPRVRLAFKLAMDRKSAIANVYDGLAQLTSDLVVPAGDPWYPHGLGVRPYDPAHAKKLLAQAGYRDGINLSLYTSSVYSGMSDLAVEFANSAQPAGITANIHEWAPATYWDQVWLVKNFYTTYWQSSFPPDDLWFMYAANGPFNEAKLHDPVFTQLFGKILSTSNRGKQVTYTQDALTVAANSWGHVIPGVVTSPWAASPRLKGVDGDPPIMRVRLKNAYFA